MVPFISDALRGMTFYGTVRNFNEVVLLIACYPANEKRGKYELGESRFTIEKRGTFYESC